MMSSQAKKKKSIKVHFISSITTKDERLLLVRKGRADQESEAGNAPQRERGHRGIRHLATLWVTLLSTSGVFRSKKCFTESYVVRSVERIRRKKPALPEVSGICAVCY